jgi:hypothetical protein
MTGLSILRSVLLIYTIFIVLTFQDKIDQIDDSVKQLIS